MEYETVGEFLVDIRKEFGGGDEELVKVAELKRLEQEEKMIEEFVQEFQKAARDSEYEGKLLIEDFKRGMSGVIRRKLMKAERPLTSIEQWYKHAINLDRHWKESRRENERLKGRWEQRVLVLRQQKT